jgi:hypothetical protein
MNERMIGILAVSRGEGSRTRPRAPVQALAARSYVSLRSSMRATGTIVGGQVGVIILALSALHGGCGPVTTFTARGAACAERPTDCELTVIDRRPERDFRVIGVLDVEAFSVRRIPRDDETFLALVRSDVCKAGGDAVIPGVTGDGRYVQATIVKWIEPKSTEPFCPPEMNDVPEEPVDVACAGPTSC